MKNVSRTRTLLDPQQKDIQIVYRSGFVFPIFDKKSNCAWNMKLTILLIVAANGWGCYRFEVWAFSFSPRCPSSLRIINEYLAIYTGGNVGV